MTDLADCTATELMELYATREASPVEVTSACLERIEATDGAINAILLLLEDDALKQAAESEQADRQQKEYGPECTLQLATHGQLPGRGSEAASGGRETHRGAGVPARDEGLPSSR